MTDSKDRMGDVLRKKEKALLDLLAKHPKANMRSVESIRSDVDFDMSLLQAERTRSHRYTSDDISIKTFDDDSNYDMRNMQTVVDQTLLDMQHLRTEKDRVIADLTSKLEEKSRLLEGYIDREKSIKHYGSLLIKSANIYVHKSSDEIDESDKIYLLKLSSTLSKLLDGEPVEKNSISKLARRASLNAVPFDVKQEQALINASKSVKEQILPPPESNESTDTPMSQIRKPNESREHHTSYTNFGFIGLTGDMESMSDALFTQIYRLSLLRLDIGSKDSRMVVQEQQEDEPLHHWIGKKKFISMCLILNIIDDRLTLQAAANCFDKAARDSLRGQSKLSNRLYLNDFVGCMILASSFKYQDEEKGMVDEDTEKAWLEKLLRFCLSSQLLHDTEAYLELSRIFDRISDQKIFMKLSPRQVFLSRAYRRSKNYLAASTDKESTIVGPSGRMWPSRTAANGGKRNRDRGELVLGGGFYHFCRVYRIFPALTSDNVVRRIAQHVRKFCDEGTGGFIASLMYLSLSLGNNLAESNPVSEGDLHTRVATILERIICQVEGISLHTAVGKASETNGNDDNGISPPKRVQSKESKNFNIQRSLAQGLVSTPLT